jgi:hypothetical protein
MTLPRTPREKEKVPEWVDKARLCFEASVSERTVDALVKLGKLPAPRRLGGKLVWRWADVDRRIEQEGLNVSASDPFSEEAIRERTQREVANVRPHRH